MHQTQGRDNAQSLFGLLRLPSDPQNRNLLDPVAPQHLGSVFAATHTLVRETGVIELAFRTALGTYALTRYGWFEAWQDLLASCPTTCACQTPAAEPRPCPPLLAAVHLLAARALAPTNPSAATTLRR